MFAVVSVLVLCAFLQVIVAGCARDTPKYPEVHARDGVVTVEIAGIGAGGGRFHSYRTASGKIVDLLVYRDSAGAPHAVLDACRTCYRWKKGYLLEGPDVICVKCDMRFKLDGLAQGIGSCVPIQLTSEPRDNALAIPVPELEAGARYF